LRDIPNVHSLIVIQHNQLIAEWYYPENLSML
jgi:hypothetical protein